MNAEPVTDRLTSAFVVRTIAFLQFQFRFSSDGLEMVSTASKSHLSMNLSKTSMVALVAPMNDGVV